jgi:(4-(4-[2-(gamma-L-glutamylamino)ethyl]phenoxymethyl)furan-2-yl)methanamine synthase
VSATQGWDIGGAHLKLARVERGRVIAARQMPCPLWLGFDRLNAALDEALSCWPEAERHAVTMTAELADLFPDRATGVRSILDALTRRVPEASVRVYANDGGLLSPEAAAAAPERVASANWHASAQLAARRLRDALLVDIGSTTTDLVPLRRGQVAAEGVDDAGRLARGELVYRGVVRTPVMAIAAHVALEGERVGVMAELFATAADVFRLTGELPADADQQPTPDGRGKSAAESRARLARMVGRDAASAPDAVWDGLARHIARRLLREIAAAARAVAARAGLPPRAPVIGAGIGRFLAAALAERLGRPYRAYESVIPAADAEIAALAASCAPAAAVALLAEAPPMSARKRATAAASSGASREPRVSAERKPRKSGASGSSAGTSAAASEPARPASSPRPRARAMKRRSSSAGK